MSWDEDRLQRWIWRTSKNSVAVGSPGHDACVLAAPGGREVLCIDACIEGVHFEATAAPGRVGHKAAARALSDLAATAAEPRALLLALTAPRERPEAWLRAAIGGVRRAGAECGAARVGGDLSAARGSELQLVVSALGVLPGRAKPPGRDRARPGQRLVLTGPVGGSALGRHLDFCPRLAEGRELFQAGATAMMDISDGLAWDLWRLARASGVRLELDRVPLHKDARRMARKSGQIALFHGLHDGEDHELVASLPRDAPLPAGALEIGRVVEGSGLALSRKLVALLEGGGAARDWQPHEGGWRHGE